MLALIASVLLFFVSLALLRVDVGFTAFDSWSLLEKKGIVMGFSQDLAWVLIGCALVCFACVVAPRKFRTLFRGLLGLSFLLNLADHFYFKYFSNTLEPWMVIYHFRDLLDVKASVGKLALSVWFVMAIATVAALWWFVGRTDRGRRASGMAHRLGYFVGAVALLWSGVVVEQLQYRVPKRWMLKLGWPDLPVYFGARQPLSDQVCFRWTLRAGVPKSRALVMREEATAYLARFRDLQVGAPLDTIAPNDSSELFRERIVAKDEAARGRSALGLDPKVPPSFLVVFGESVRAFEFFHPEVGPLVFPRLRKILDQYGMVFEQSYSMSNNAGQTVRGIYSALCSQFPNMLGLAPMVSDPDFTVTCATDLLNRASYETYWFAGSLSNFHREDRFEAAHHTQHILDKKDFIAKGFAEEFEWGVKDNSLFQAVQWYLSHRADPKLPFFAHAKTVGTHHPWGPPEEVAPLPTELSKKLARHPLYLNYLARLRYFDESMARLVEGVFSNPILRDTVILFSADHSIGEKIPAEFGKLNDIQQEELKFRIPIFILSRKIPKARRVKSPKSQMDIGPTLVSLAGAKGKESFLGHSLLAESEATPWVYQYLNGALNWRWRDEACYESDLGRRICARVGGEDPLYAVGAYQAFSEPKSLTQFFQRVIAAESLVFENRMLKKE